MGKTAFPYGMRSVGKTAANYFTGGFTTHAIAPGYATVINFGDVVKRVADGTIEKDTGTTSLTPLGVFIGCEYTDAAGRYQFSQSWPGGAFVGAKAKVVTDPDERYYIQADGPIAQTAVGANAAIIQTAGAVGLSRNALQASSVATTGTLPLRIESIAEMPDNVAGDAFTEVIVRFNTHISRAASGI